MATTTNGVLEHSEEPPISNRFSDVPTILELPVQDAEVGLVDLNLEELADDPTELCTLLEEEHMPRKYWTMVSMAYARQKQNDHSIEIIRKAIEAQPKNQINDKLYLYNTLCWLYLLKSRQAPRVASDSHPDPDTKTKDFYLKAATSTLNDASRLNPSFQPLLLARGVLCLLRAALTQNQSEKLDILRQASKAFDDSLRGSEGKYTMAMIGRARTKYSMGKWADALKDYQYVMQWAPDVRDPDPRIGIGCCFWQLKYPEEARDAWARAHEINPNSKAANILLGVYHLQASGKLPTNHEEFRRLYAESMTGYTQTAFKLDNMFPMACAMFANFFLARRAYDKVDTLASRAVELTDVSTIASDGWYSRARKEHYNEDHTKAADFYQKSDDARGGEERGYLPAKFGTAQLRVLQEDYEGAKLRLEKVVQRSKNLEAMSLLGSLLAEDVFNSRLTTPQEGAAVQKRAISILEAVRSSWKDPSKQSQQDATVLLNLARLYEVDVPEKALGCLREVEKAEIDELADAEPPEDEDGRVQWLASIREKLSPQLLSNIGCFHFNAERFEDALTTFQTALKACTLITEGDSSSIDSDALVTTISYNLARTYEAVGLLDEASEVYDGLLDRHADYTDAKIRQVLIRLKQSPNDKGQKAMAKLYETDSTDLEVRSLYGWFIRKAKKKTSDVREDQEQRHFKHTLQHHDKYDRFALTGLGNLYLTNAREMKRETDDEKRRRNDQYELAVQFFDKALQLDPRNAYAAQGIAIAMIECRRDFGGALQIFTKIKDTIKDASVHINLGHVYCEVKQYPRAIEAYEMALKKDRQNDPPILACLGRAWLLRGKAEKSATAMKTSLEYSRKALEVAPEQIQFRFNVAFVQTQLAQLIIGLPEIQRSVEELEAADKDLDAANEAFSAIAKSPNPPFPRNDIEQRANMGRNTMKKQLDRAMQKQREFEERNADKLRKAREDRAAAQARVQEAQRLKAEADAEEQRKIREQRAALAQKDREMAEQRKEEERRRAEEEEAELDSDGNVKRRAPRKKGGAGKRKKKEDDFVNDSDLDGDRPSGSVTPNPDVEKPRKKRKLERKAPAKSSKFKSAERIEDSDDDDAPADAEGAAAADDDMEMTDGNEDGDEPSMAATSGKRRNRVLDDDEEGNDGNASDEAPAPIFDDDDDE